VDFAAHYMLIMSLFGDKPVRMCLWAPGAPT
jgi:hypothetical protein